MVNDIINDARKVAYLVYLYPKKGLQQIAELMSMPPIAKDCAIIEASRQGWVEISKKKGQLTLTTEEIPEPTFDDMMVMIRDRVRFIIKHHNSEEQDIDEVVLLQMLVGYPVQDILITLNLMLDEGTIANYTIAEGKKGENVYTFWTMPENVGKEWGRKRFPDQSTLKVGASAKLEA